MVGPATRLPKALALINTESFDAALLDINLDGEMSWPAAAALLARGIPVVLCTGYEINPMLPYFLKGSKILRKPYSADDLEGAMLDLLRQRA